MMKTNAYCDICGIQKQQTNHWWVLEIRNGSLAISEWSDKKARRKGVVLICGTAHLHQYVDAHAEKCRAKNTVESAMDVIS